MRESVDILVCYPTLNGGVGAISPSFLVGPLGTQSGSDHECEHESGSDLECLRGQRADGNHGRRTLAPELSPSLFSSSRYKMVEQPNLSVCRRLSPKRVSTVEDGHHDL